MKTDMKRLLVAVFCAAFGVVSMAEDYTYPYLVFTNSSGTQTVVAVDELEIAFSNGQLVATNSEGTQTMLTLAELASMRFSTAMPTGIQSLNSQPSTLSPESSTFYDLSGRTAIRKNGNAPVRKGVYVVRKADGSTTKIAVK